MEPDPFLNTPSQMALQHSVQPTTLLAYFVNTFLVDTPFVQAFLHGKNLLIVQRMLTEQLRRQVENPSLPTVEFSEAILSALMKFAITYQNTHVTPETLARANYVFADEMAEQNEGRYYETAFWKRWCTQGIPDPNNIPLPIQGDRPDFTVETGAYILNNPIGYNKFPHW